MSSTAWTRCLPNYNEFGCCPKCGADSVRIMTKHTCLAFELGDVLRRTCGRCEYFWDEQPKDHDEQIREDSVLQR